MTKPYLGEDLVFLISQPRSGSTLLQRVLFGHPEIQTSAETWLMLHPLYAFRTNSLSVEYNAKSAARGVMDFLANYTSGEEVYDDAIRQWAKVLYGQALEHSGRKYFLDKTPRYFFIIPDLYRLFPKARFIFLLRNPLAVLYSLLSTYVREDWPRLGFFRADLLQAPRLILSGMNLLGQDAIIVHYEDLVSYPEQSIASLCDQLGIAFHEEMLDYGRTEQPKGKLNDPVGVHQHTRPSKESLEKWRKLSENRQMHYFATCYLSALGNEVLEGLGYNPDELINAFPGISDQDGGLFPFALALKARQDWTFRDWISAKHYYMVKEKGRPLGDLYTLKKSIFRGMYLLKKQLERSGQG